MAQEKSCGAVVFTRVDGEIKYVLVRQLEGLYGFPKGHVERGETELETAMREIREEVGLTPTIIDGFVTSTEYALPKKKGVTKKVVYFLAEYENQEIVIQESELMDAHLATYDEAMGLFRFDNTKRILTEANDFLCRQ